MTTLGQPSNVPSNRAAYSGVPATDVGRVYGGPLQTIGEDQAALSTGLFYYPEESSRYRAPSSIRSHGDANQTFSNTNFGARSTVTLPRRYMNNGPALLRFRLPIEYAWAGCEYVSNLYQKSGATPTVTSLTYNTAALGPPVYATKDYMDSKVIVASGSQYHFESPGCSTMLPTSFQSGGVGFAFLSSVEMSLGGAGQITIDRYSNFAAIMASTPFTNVRKDLMRMAGGGLNLYDLAEAKQAPVRWGEYLRAPWRNCTGHSQTQIPYYDGTAFPVDVLDATARSAPPGLTAQVDVRSGLVPVEWDVLVPIKTPETNFMYALQRRKPLDTKCLGGNLQYTFDWGRFDDWSDTGRGYPNAPVYFPQFANFPGPENLPATGNQTIVPYTGTAPYGFQDLQINQFQKSNPCDYELGAPVNVCLSHFDGQIAQQDWDPAVWNIVAPDFISLSVANCIRYTPVVWTNHYRVASGRKMTDVLAGAASCQMFTYTDAANQPVAGNIRGGRGRYPTFESRQNPVNVNVVDYRRSVQMDADTVNSKALLPAYPRGFTSVEYINSSLKLTNELLGAYNDLRSQQGNCLYYPFQYFFSQTYPILRNPFKDIKTFNIDNIKDVTDKYMSNIYSDNLKITQLISMPNNPCTSMIIGFYREKDRRSLTRNGENSYSPALFWNALNPERVSLKDGGNVLFDYVNNIDAEMMGFVDRPDPLKIPFRGGLSQVSPQGVHIPKLCPGGGANSGQGTYELYNEFSVFEADKGERMVCKPFWTTLYRGAALLGMDDGLGTRGYSSRDMVPAPDMSINAFPVSDIVPLLATSVDSKKFQPCHMTEWYESTLIEFPFAMAEPIVNEAVVQNTLTFKNTQLTLDFWINPLLKPDNGMDDMYDITYGLTRGAPSGLIPYDTNININSRLTWPNPCSHPVPDCLSDNYRKLSADALIRSKFIPTDSSIGTTDFARPGNAYINAFDFKETSSWNINNGNLMMHVVFCQNQVWCISPLKTTILNSNG
jgi:hypothetical protein